jgi:hypothetical protein
MGLTFSLDGNVFSSRSTDVGARDVRHISLISEYETAHPDEVPPAGTSHWNRVVIR